MWYLCGVIAYVVANNSYHMNDHDTQVICDIAVVW